MKKNPTGTKNQTRPQKKEEHKHVPKKEGNKHNIQAQALEASQIRNLIRNNGRLAIGECEYSLKQPSSNDAQLQQIVRDPSFTARQAAPLQNSSENKYELRSSNRTAQITIDCKRNNRT